MVKNDEGGVRSSLPNDTTVTSADELASDSVKVTVIE